MIPVIDPGSAIGALRYARRLIDEDHERFICLALVETGMMRGHFYGETRMLKDYIQDRVPSGDERLSNLEHWLDNQLDKPMGFSGWVYKQCRLAWIDRMIHELETNGSLP